MDMQTDCCILHGACTAAMMLIDQENYEKAREVLATAIARVEVTE